MSNIKSGAAAGSISVKDKTDQGLKSAKDRFEKFGDEINRLEKRMRPMQEVMKGSMAVGGMTAGFGLLLEQSNKLSAGLQGLSGNISSLEGTTGSATSAIQTLIQTMTVNPLVTMGTIIGGLSTGGMALIQVIKQLILGLKGATLYIGMFNEAVRANAAAQAIDTAATAASATAQGVEAGATAASAGAKIANTAASAASATAKTVETAATTTSTTATVAETIAKTANTTVTYAEVEARMTSANATMQDTIARAANLSVRMMENGQTTISTIATAKNTAGKAGNTVSILTNSAAQTGNTVGLLTNSAAQAANTTATIAGGTALGWYGYMCSAAAVATNWLTVAMATNPFVFWFTAITAAVVAIGAIGIAIYQFFNSSKTRAELMKEEAEAAGKAAAKYKELGEELSAKGATDDTKLDRLKQLNAIINKTIGETREAQRLAKELQEAYGTDNVKAIKRKKTDDRQANLERESRQLTNQNYSGAVDEETVNKNNKRLKQIRVELDYYRRGGTEDVTGKSEKDIIQMRIDATKKIQEQKYAEYKKRLETIQKQRDEIKKGLDLQKSLEKEIADQTKTALQKELEAAQDKTAERRKQLEIAVQEGLVSAKNAKAENEQLDDLVAKRQEQIRAKYQEEENLKKAAANDFYASAMAKIRQEQADKSTERKDKNLTDKIADNPFEAYKIIQHEMGKAASTFANADKAYQNSLKSFGSDGFYSDEEKKRLAELEKTRADALKKSEKMNGFNANAEARIQDGIRDLLKKTRSVDATPIDAAQKGSAEAFKQAMENRARAAGDKSPEAAEAEAIKKQLIKQYDEQKRKKDEELKLTKQIVEELKGAAV